MWILNLLVSVVDVERGDLSRPPVDLGETWETVAGCGWESSDVIVAGRLRVVDQHDVGE